MSLGDWMRQKKEKEAVAKQAKADAEIRSDPIEEEGAAEKDIAVEDVDMPLAPPASEVAAPDIDPDADAEGEAEEGEVISTENEPSLSSAGQADVKQEEEKAVDEVPEAPPTTASTTAESL